MYLNLCQSDIPSFLPISIIDNSIIIKKSVAQIKIGLSAIDNNIQINILDSTILGLSFFGFIRSKINSLIMSELKKYKINSYEFKGNIIMSIPKLLFNSVSINDNSVNFSITIRL